MLFEGGLLRVEKASPILSSSERELAGSPKPCKGSFRASELFGRIRYLGFNASPLLRTSRRWCMDKPTLSILAVEDEETLLQMLSRILERHGFYVDTAPDGRVAINMLQTLPYDVVLLDVMMPEVDGIQVLRHIKEHHLDTEVIMLSAIQNVDVVVECMKLGAFYYTLKPYVPNDLFALIERAGEHKRLVMQNEALKRQVAYHSLPSNIVGNNKILLELLDKALQAAPTNSSVLIEGAKGTGKELVANFIHANSIRKEQPFLAVNCASMQERLLEGELFGHEEGALSAELNWKQGLIEIANGGTLLLDHVADLPPSLQTKLLGFMKSGEFRRLGGDKNLRSDVRIISATNKNLQHEVVSGRFSDELLLVLNVITLQLPSLRDRKEDIRLLTDQFLKDRAGVGPPKRLDEGAMKALMNYDWPGNVRELENVIERAAVLCKGDVIGIGDLVLAPSSVGKKSFRHAGPSRPSGRRPTRKRSVRRYSRPGKRQRMKAKSAGRARPRTK